MRLRILALVFTLLAAPGALAQNAPAAPSAAAQAAAKEAFKRGEAAYSAGNYDVAVREWTSAYSSDPRPRIQFNLSQAYERMGQLQDAIDSLKRFLDAADPEDPTYSDANARYVALQQRLSSTGVMVQGGTEGGQILVDDQDWGRTPRPDKIAVSPGNHVVVVRWPQGGEFRTNVYVPAGQVANLVVDGAGGGGQQVVAPTPVQTAAAATNVNQPPPVERDKKKIILYAAGAGTAAVGVGLLVYGIVRGNATSKCGKHDKLGLETYCNPDDKDAAHRQSIAGYVTGGVLIAGGAALMVVNALTGRDEAPRASRCDVGLASANCSFQF